jgi:acetyl-CoA synthetase
MQISRFLQGSSFEDMYRYSVDDIGGFTEQVIRFLNIQFHRPYERILDLSRGIQWPEWCVGGGLNISTTCLDLHPPDRLAVIWEGEEGITRQLTYRELKQQVESCAAGLRRLGVRRGDAVAIHLPMMPETVVSLLAVARIGAVSVPLFSGYGPAAIESRVRDVGAKVIITCDAFPRRGVRMKARENCPPVEHLIVVPRMGEGDGLPSGDRADVEPTAAEDPLIILYTSGTTGRPKGIVHTHCGFPIKVAQDMCFGTDVGAGTRITWITDIGWVMGPWLLLGATILGGTMVLYDGAPDYPDPGRIWRFCAQHGVEVLGISPTLVRLLAARGEVPTDLGALRLFGSTGEPWNPEPWSWLSETVGRGRIPIINYSGGTEISGGILMGNPLLPSKPCSFPAPCPGIAADIVDERGETVPPGAVGELVIRKPWIGMARGFLNDPQRYLDTYWSRWPNLWAHGDWATRDTDGHWYILGRSDDTLKVAGKRVGPA